MTEQANAASGGSPWPVVAEHLKAFNAHDSARLLAGLAKDAQWITGSDVIEGHDELADVFDAGLWAMDPSLDVLRAAAGPGTVAVELLEQMTKDGEVRQFHIAVFYDVADGLIQRVKVFREGNAVMH
jgi:hypothetical protein